MKTVNCMVDNTWNGSVDVKRIQKTCNLSVVSFKSLTCGHIGMFIYIHEFMYCEPLTLLYSWLAAAMTSWHPRNIWSDNTSQLKFWHIRSHKIMAASHLCRHWTRLVVTPNRCFAFMPTCWFVWLHITLTWLKKHDLNAWPQFSSGRLIEWLSKNFSRYLSRSIALLLFLWSLVKISHEIKTAALQATCAV